MDTLSSTHLVERNPFMITEEEKEEEEWNNEGDVKGDTTEVGAEDDIQNSEAPDDLGNKHLAVQRGQKPSFCYKEDKEVYCCVGQEIVIQQPIDSFAGMMPAAVLLCQYLENHCEQLSLLDKTVLEIGAGNGLLSIVATLLGGWVTSTDLPDVLGILRLNLSKNTRGRCRHTPQVTALSWGHDLEHTYPKSVYRYDYILAADVVYQHNFLDELLATMKHFCQPGTTLIWANRVSFEMDLSFNENFKKTFHTDLLFEDAETKIFTATCRAVGEEATGLAKEMPDTIEKEQWEKPEDDHETEIENAEGMVCNINEFQEQNHYFKIKERNTSGHKDSEVDNGAVCEKTQLSGPERDAEKGESDDEQGEIEEEERCSQLPRQTVDVEDERCEEEENQKTENSKCSATANADCMTGDEDTKLMAVQGGSRPAWMPWLITRHGKDIYYYVGQEISIYESIDSYGAVMWPAALALCSYLDTNRQRIDLSGKEVLELGAGTGLVAIVASLLGASVTATDLPDVLGNLRANVMRNTRGRCKHTPRVTMLSWGHDLEHNHPKSAYRYDYILAADVVYHHNFLDELLATMKHFCQPETTLIWANKIRFETDLTFTENLKKTFHTDLLFEDGEMKIFMATYRRS